MPCYRDERSCVKHLRELMKNKYPQNAISTHRNIEKKFSAKWRQFFDELPPTTHEIDLVRGFKDKEGRKIIEGIEVKYFQRAKEGRSYIERFGQALGLLLWGFNLVTVYHVFDQEFDEKERKRFVRTSVELSRHLDLVDYRAFLTKKEREVEMYQLDNSGSETKSSPFIHPGRKKNPFLQTNRDSRLEKRREFIETEILGFVP